MSRCICAVFYSCLLLLVCLIVLHGAPIVERWDLAMLKGVQRVAGPGLDDVALFMAVVGGPFFSLLFIGGLSIAYWRRRWVRAMFLFWGLFVLLTGFEVLSKTQIDHPRPPEELKRKVQITGLLRKLPDVTIPTNNSFPSGHCLRAVFLMGILVMFVRSGKRAMDVSVTMVAVAYGIVACWSRIYLGVHWPSDVMAGWLIGAAISFVIFKIATESESKK